MSKPLWTPSAERIEQANITRFRRLVNQRLGLKLDTWDELWAWSVRDLPAFWELFWDFAEVQASRRFDLTVDDPARMPGARWFPGARLNFAENLLRRRDGHHAIVSYGETGLLRRWSYAELRRDVARLAQAMAASGVRAGDKVAAYMPNIGETVVAMLAATSLGATWTSSSPDLGVHGVVDRFGQTRPRLLVSADGYRYNGKVHDLRPRLRELMEKLPSVEQVVVVPFIEAAPSLEGIRDAVDWKQFLGPARDVEPSFVQVPAEAPLYIMYSSGTTGLPKCIVQSVGGVLLHHLKELMLHVDLKAEDTIYFYTTCGWMMWNWVVSSLATGATVLLYDGSPVYPSPNVQWRMAQDEGVSIFGAGARFHDIVRDQGMRPRDFFQLHRLRTVLSTGSPLSPESFEHIYRHVKTDIHLASISGGTDLNGCLAIGNPILPVYAGEMQCRPLGMAVESFDPEGRPLRDQRGELVCTRAFPSVPLGFCNGDDARYLATYFERYPGIWHHGDYVEIRSSTGGLVIHGRSDATLNPGGVRIGTADLYRVVDGLPGVADSLAVGQRWKGDERIVLFVKLQEGLQLTEQLRERIRGAIRSRLTPRHLPALIIQIADIPYTVSMKKVEVAVRQVIHGEPVPNRDALANPAALDLFKDLKELQE